MKCPKCGSNSIGYEDESFSHAFGTKIIQYYFCCECDWVGNENE